MRSAYLTYLMMALTVVVGCGDETIHDTVVKVSGQHSLEVGNTLALSAETLNGTDTSYTWSSGDTTIATVDGSGVVTAIAVGETSITATGDSTKVAGAHALVVVGAGSVQVVVSGQHAVEVGKTLALSASTQNGTDGSVTVQGGGCGPRSGVAAWLHDQSPTEHRAGSWRLRAQRQ